MYEKPKNWLSFSYNGFRRYVVDWRIAEGREGRTDYIGFEKRKNGKFVNKVKRYNGNLMVEVEYGDFREDGTPGPALYSERVSNREPIYESVDVDTVWEEENVPEPSWTIRNLDDRNPNEFIINLTTNTANATDAFADFIEREVSEWNPQ